MSESETPVEENPKLWGMFPLKANLKANQTTWKKEVLGGLTTFFAMCYIIAVNPSILSQAGMEWGAVFIATCLSAIVGTLVMGMFANVPYAQAPGMGLNAFFTFTVSLGLGFSWQETLSMVFLCGVINILITVTRIRKMLIKAIPEALQSALSGGIGCFLIFLGLLNVGLINFAGGVPALSNIATPALGVFIFGLILCLVLNVLKVPGAMVISIVATTLFGLIPFGAVDAEHQVTFVSNFDFGGTLVGAFQALPTTFGIIFTPAGFGALFSNAARLPLVLITIFAFSMSDTFDTIGTFIGTGKRTGIFSASDIQTLEQGNGMSFKSKMDRALFSDSIATSVGAVLGTSNTTTFVESAAGIGAGARTGLASVVTAACFFLSIFIEPLVAAIPNAATAPVLIVVGCMMLANFKDIRWDDLEEAIPAMFSSLFMAFSYSISYGIGWGFLSYILVKVSLYGRDWYFYQKALKSPDAMRSDEGTVHLVDGEGKEREVCKPKLSISPILWVASALFLLNFILLPVMDLIS